MPEDIKEGDLFGVRAIESGFFGGIAQSRPGSAASSRAPSSMGQSISPATSFSGGLLLCGSPSHSLSGAPLNSATPPRAPFSAVPSQRSSLALSFGSAANHIFQAPSHVRDPESCGSFRGPSPLSRAPVVADEHPRLSLRSTSLSHRYLPLPTRNELHTTPLRPSVSSDPGRARPELGAYISPALHLHGSEGPIHVVPSHAPQIDQPSKALSPGRRASFVGQAESGGSREAAKPTQFTSDRDRPRRAMSSREIPKTHVRSFSRPLSPKSQAPAQPTHRPTKQIPRPSGQLEEPGKPFSCYTTPP